MKMKLMLLGLALAPTMLLADHHDQVWGVAELEVAQKYAVSKFRADNGEALYAAIAGFSIDRMSTGDSARAKVTYVDGGVRKAVSYFCHYHSDEIDCH